ncbi:MAG: hypothetical protein HYR83_09400 [Planctomycetes bacterium]|nr:hypothetical protein [Planctomycetota bacterium]
MPTCLAAESCPSGCAIDCDPELYHGCYAGAACQPRCVGDTLSCTSTLHYADELSDVIRIEQAFDTVKESKRVPETGNLPLVKVSGNAICTDSGGSCNPGNGRNCAFPCLVAAGDVNYQDSETGLTLPGMPQVGLIRVADNLYVIQPEEVGHLESQITFVSVELCTSCCSSCPQTCETYSASASTAVPGCADDGACSVASCIAGVCNHVPKDCDDGDPCTIDSCDDMGGCIHTSKSCDDDDPCTIDNCDTSGECTHDPKPCGPDEVCRNGECQPVCDENGKCETGENCSNCPKDCISSHPGCGNGVCEPSLGEDCVSCPADCNGIQAGKSRTRFCCGSTERGVNVGCRDPRCNTNGFACSSVPVESCCGDSVCEGLENPCNCAIDCGDPPAHEEPGATCNDGIDNDCDGLIDGEDPDCGCAASGSRCTSGVQCCSGICKGRGVCR